FVGHRGLSRELSLPESRGTLGNCMANRASMVRLHSRLKMRHMLLLRTLGTTLNSRRAALEMNISQPSASALLREIEDAVGTELFEREAHGLRPTPSGRAMIEWAGIILADLERASLDLD